MNYCRLCNSNSLEKCYSLPPAFIADTFLRDAYAKSQRYKYDLFVCRECHHVQTHDVLPPQMLFGNSYTYTPSYSTALRSHFQNYANEITNVVDLNTHAQAIDIGSNDGLFLKCLRERTGCAVLGIEPAEGPRNFAIENGIETKELFFSREYAKELKSEMRKPVGLISANNVFAHCNNLDDFTGGVVELLDYNGFFCFEFSHLLKIIERDLVGVYFHEHLSHHSLVALDPFLKRHGLTLVDAFEVDSQGGSVIGIAQKRIITNGEIVKSKRLQLIISKEKKAGLDSSYLGELVDKSFQRASNNFESAMKQFATGTRIGLFGASRSLATLDAFYNLAPKVCGIYDDNKNKLGLFYPETSLMVKPTSEMTGDSIDAVVITAWVPTEQIVKGLRLSKKARYAVRLLSPIRVEDITS